MNCLSADYVFVIQQSIMVNAKSINLKMQNVCPVYEHLSVIYFFFIDNIEIKWK